MQKRRPVAGAAFAGVSQLSLPAAGLALVLFFQPGLQRGEVGDEGGAIHLAVAGEGFESIRPRLAGAISSIFVNFAPTSLLP